MFKWKNNFVSWFLHRYDRYERPNERKFPVLNRIIFIIHFIGSGFKVNQFSLSWHKILSPRTAKLIIFSPSSASKSALPFMVYASSCRLESRKKFSSRYLWFIRFYFSYVKDKMNLTNEKIELGWMKMFCILV